MLKIDNKADIFHYRTLMAILTFSMLLLVGRYFHLQIIEHERFFSKSQVNRVKAKASYAPRGLIVDRNGVVIVENSPTYILTVTPYEMKNIEDQFDKISSIISVPIEEIERRYKKYYRGKFLPTVIAKNLSFAQISQIEEMKLDFPGVQYERFDERLYNTELNDMHILGYLRELDRETVPTLDKSSLYRAGELIGWQGVEREYEKELRYSKGVNYIEVDTYGREIENLNNNNIPAYPGKNLVLTIDSELQKFSRNLLEGKKGSIIVSKVNSGEILSIVSLSLIHI